MRRPLPASAQPNSKSLLPREQPIVTTSWDDGHPLDVRLAELLSSYGVPGTFYLPLMYSKIPLLGRPQMRAIRALGMEIGAHGLGHSALTRSMDVFDEVRGSKDRLQDLLGESISAFSYPRGEFNREVCQVVASAGYRLARTTVAFRTSKTFDPYRMPVSLHFTQHGQFVHMRHALKDLNLHGLTQWWKHWRFEDDPVRLSECMLDHVIQTNGILHIWGHSWELEEHQMWDAMESLLRRIAHRPGVRYLTNTGTLEAVTQ